MNLIRTIKNLLIVFIIIITCSACGTDTIKYEGNYTSDDESLLTITKTNDNNYEIIVNIVRLTLIDDGIGILDTKSDTMSFVATDAAGNPIGGEIRWLNSDDVELEFTNSTWEYLSNGTIISFKRNSDVDDNNKTLNDIGEIEDTSYKDSILPEVDVNSSYLGTSYSTFKAKGMVRYEVPVSGEFLTFIKDTGEDGIEYFIIDDKVYVGVKDDTIVGFIQYGYPTELLVNDWIQQDEFYNNPPKIIQNGNFVLLGWQINNGYLIISAVPTNNNEWYKYRPNWIVQINSLEQCNIDW